MAHCAVDSGIQYDLENIVLLQNKIQNTKLFSSLQFQRSDSNPAIHNPSSPPPLLVPPPPLPPPFTPHAGLLLSHPSPSA